MPADDPDQGPPPVAAVLPDGQEVRGRLHARAQQPDGSWLFQVGVPLWQLSEAGTVQASEYRTWLTPGQQTLPIDGIDYSQVPTWPARSAAPATPPPSRWAWTVQRLPGGRGTVVHTHDCQLYQAADDIDLDQALTALQRAGAQACKECDAAASLIPLL